MLTELAKRKAVLWRGVWHLPVNVCSHCGEEDDPETTAHWPVDDDDDRICPSCATGISYCSNCGVPLNSTDVEAKQCTQCGKEIK